MAVELSKEERQRALTSIERYFSETLESPIGNIAAAGVLNYFLEEIGPCLYNRGVADAQERLQMRVSELDFEVHEDAFGYWSKYDAGRKPRR